MEASAGDGAGTGDAGVDLRAAAVTLDGASTMRLRVASYNVHKCQGFDRRVLPERIVAVIREFAADVICLQEVVHAPGGIGHWNQAEEIARGFPGWAWCFG